MTHQHPTVDELVHLEQETFARIISDNVAPDDAARPGVEISGRRELWKILTEPLIIGRSFQALSSMLRNLDDQLAARKSSLDAFEQQCFAQGHEGKQRWFNAKREHEEWRHRTLGYKRIVQRRYEEVKAIRQQQLNTNPVLRAAARFGTVPNEPKKRNNYDALFRLAYAVAKHRDNTSEEGLLPTPHDVELWYAMDRIEVCTSGDKMMTLADWVEEITSKEGFEPRPDM